MASQPPPDAAEHEGAHATAERAGSAREHLPEQQVAKYRRAVNAEMKALAQTRGELKQAQSRMGALRAQLQKASAGTTRTTRSLLTRSQLKPGRTALRSALLLPVIGLPKAANWPVLAWIVYFGVLLWFLVLRRENNLLFLANYGAVGALAGFHATLLVFSVVLEVWFARRGQKMAIKEAGGLREQSLRYQPGGQYPISTDDGPRLEALALSTDKASKTIHERRLPTLGGEVSPSPAQILLVKAAAADGARNLAVGMQEASGGPPQNGLYQFPVLIVTSLAGHRIEAEVQQGSFKDAYSGTGQVQTAIIPSGPHGMEGRLRARDLDTGEEIEVTWDWVWFGGMLLQWLVNLVKMLFRRPGR